MLPTPTAAAYGTGGNGSQKGKQRQVVSLQTMAARDLWPTPCSSDMKGACLNRSPGKERPTCDDDLPTRVARRDLWPTPTASGCTMGTVPPDAVKNCTGYVTPEGETIHHVTLRAAVIHEEKRSEPRGSPCSPDASSDTVWPTPAASDATRRTEYYARGNPTLLGAVRLEAGETRQVWDRKAAREQQRQWPTPTTKDATSGPGHAPSAEGAPNLRTAVAAAEIFPTPTSRDHRSGATTSSTSRGRAPPLTEHVCLDLPPTAPRVLNPEFVTWLMGYPALWSMPSPESIARLTSAKKEARRSSRRTSGTASGPESPAS